MTRSELSDPAANKKYNSPKLKRALIVREVTLVSDKIRHRKIGKEKIL